MPSSLSDSQKIKAKEKAIQFLEKSIFELSLQLYVDESELTESYTIPVQESDPMYSAYESLVKMATNLRELNK